MRLGSDPRTAKAAVRLSDEPEVAESIARLWKTDRELASDVLGKGPLFDERHQAVRLIGLDPNGHKLGVTGPVAFFAVEDIERSLKELEGAGAKVLQPAKNVGGGMLVAYLTDDDGNATGLLQLPE